MHDSSSHNLIMMIIHLGTITDKNASLDASYVIFNLKLDPDTLLLVLMLQISQNLNKVVSFSNIVMYIGIKHPGS